jgi:mannose-6-phosphate isomerase-like protein (cupin superfamily)
MAKQFELTNEETLTLRRSAAETGGELTEVAGEWRPGKGTPPPPHFHPKQDEHFEVHEGELTVKLDGEQRVLRPGEALDIPRGVVHAMWNAGSVPARATWQVRPALRTEDFWDGMTRLRAAGHKSSAGLVDLPGAALLFGEFRDEIRLKMSPVVTGGLMPLLAAWARVRGYERALR